MTWFFRVRTTADKITERCISMNVEHNKTLANNIAGTKKNNFGFNQNFFKALISLHS
jgi:hypothetical protein